MKIMIDITRSPFTGIGRYSWGLLQKLTKIDKNNSYSGIVYPGWETYARELDIKITEVIEIKEQPKSIEEINRFSGQIESKSDIFIATSFSTFHLVEKIPVIQVVHDIIYVLHPEWQPTLTDLINKHGKDRVENITKQILPIMQSYMKQFNDPWMTDNNIHSPHNQLVANIFQNTFSYYIHKSSAIISVSDVVSDQLQRYYTHLPKMVTVNPNLPDYLDIGALPQKKSSKFDLLYVANFEPRKNHGFLLDAFDALRKNSFDARLNLIGKQNYESHYKEFIQKYPDISKRLDVNYCYDIDNQQLSTFYKTADIFVFPSIDEGFGIPLLEAMYMSVPSVVVDTSIAREVCEDSAAYVDRGDVRDMANTITSLCNDHTLRAGLIQKQSITLEKYRDKNDYEKNAKLILSLLKNQ